MTTIEWVRNTDATQGRTWNPVVGCTHVSEGCDHCYAATLASGRLKTHPLYAGLAEGGKFNGTVRLVPERLDEPLRVRKPTTWFVNSMSDLFHDDVPDEFIGHVFAVMALASVHTFQVLTKRPGRMASVLPRLRAGVEDAIVERNGFRLGDEVREWPLPNVWLGTSVETQKWADVRIPQLLRTPAAVRFLSCEPLLGPVELVAAMGGRLDALRGDRIDPGDGTIFAGGSGIDWVIVGGESGRGARPMHPGWARSLRDQCVAAGVPFFFKQWGEWAPNREGPTVRAMYPDGSREDILDPDAGLDDPNLAWMFRVGKKAAGRELDGCTWDEMPGREA